MKPESDKGTVGYTWNVYDIKTGKLLEPKPEKPPTKKYKPPKQVIKKQFTEDDCPF